MMKKLILISSIAAAAVVFNACSKLTGNVAITYTKAVAVYGDLDSLRSLPLLVDKRPVENPVGFYAGKDFILVGERGKGIHIFDNLDMQNPANMSFIQIPFNKEFYVEGDYLYAESGYDMLKINISNINQPILTSRIENAFYASMLNNKRQTLLGFDYQTATDDFEIGSPEEAELKKQGKLHIDYAGKMIPLSTVPAMFTGNNGKSKGTINRIGLNKGYVYVVGKDKMHVFNNYSGFSKVKEMEVAENTETIYTDANRLYLGSQSEVTIYTLDDPSNPYKAGDVAHTTSCDPVLAMGDVAYSTLRSASSEGCGSGDNILMVINVKRASRSTEIASFDLKSPYGLSMINNYLFVGQGKNGLTIFDAKDKKSLSKEKDFENIETYDIMVHPTKNDVIITTNSRGIKEYQINWNNLSLVQVGQLNYN